MKQQNDCRALAKRGELVPWNGRLWIHIYTTGAERLIGCATRLEQTQRAMKRAAVRRGESEAWRKQCERWREAAQAEWATELERFRRDCQY